MALVDTKETAIVKFIEKRLEWARIRVQGPLKKEVAETVDVILPVITTTIGKNNNIDVDEAESIAVMLCTSIITDDRK